MAYTEGGLSPTPVKLGATVTVVWPNAAAVDAYEWAPGREEPRKGAPNASAGAAAVHANASPAASAAMAFRTRPHADAQAKRCAAGPEARVCSDSSSDDDVSSTSRRDARPARLLRASRADATRVALDAPSRRRIARYLRNVAPRAGLAGTRVPTAARVPTVARLVASVVSANERVAKRMFHERTRGRRPRRGWLVTRGVSTHEDASEDKLLMHRPID